MSSIRDNETYGFECEISWSVPYVGIMYYYRFHRPFLFDSRISLSWQFGCKIEKNSLKITGNARVDDHECDARDRR